MKKYASFLFLLFLFFNVNAQEVEIPEDYKFKIKSDYKEAEPLVLKSIEWIQNTPLLEQKSK